MCIMARSWGRDDRTRSPEDASISDALYHALIVEHDRSPRNEGPLDGATHVATLDNPLCGDVVTMRAIVTKDDPETEAMSRDAVCALDKECGLVAGSQANVRVTDIMSRNYQWNAKAGSYVATCKREYMFVGNWKCEARPGQIGR